MDRFKLKLITDYPNKEEEPKILESNANVTVHTRLVQWWMQKPFSIQETLWINYLR